MSDITMVRAEVGSVPILSSRPHNLSMSPGSAQLGFLTVIEQERAGLIGAYLVLNRMGRPLEFQCTTPVVPNTAQEILYGNSLEPFFCGEQIAQTLLNRSRIAVSHLFTDTAAVLPVQDFIEQPVIYVFPPKKAAALSNEGSEQKNAAVEISEELNQSLLSFGITDSRFQPKNEEESSNRHIPRVAGLDIERWQEAKVGNRMFAVPHGEKYGQNVEEMQEFARTIDLAEPFNRIIRAVEEAQRAA